MNVDIEPNDINALLDFAEKHRCITVVGPETPLASGIVDHFAAKGLPIVGPTREQAKLEWSKSYAKQLMHEKGIPTARYRAFSDYEKAMDYVSEQSGNVVVKADGLAAGKGVFVCSTKEEAEEAIRKLMKDRIFGDSGSRIVIEERLQGREISLMTISDGRNAIPFGTATDHKRVFDGETGPNTGGMGAYSPALKFDARDVENVMKQIVQPTVRNTGFRGFLYVALMITSEGPKAIEFNSRLGDPETQVILPRLESDLLEPLSVISNMTSNAGLLDVDLKWSKDWFCTVVMCSKGYPSSPKIGDEIKGLDRAAAISDTIIFHSGSIRKDGMLRTNSGRVLCVTAGGETLSESSSRAYSAVDLITWNGEHHRHDIGLQILDDGAVA